MSLLYWLSQAEGIDGERNHTCKIEKWGRMSVWRCNSWTKPKMQGYDELQSNMNNNNS